MINKMAAPMDIEWDKEKEEKLIDLWSQKPCLYIISSPEYSNRDAKSLANHELAQALECSVAEVKTKMVSLRAQMNRAKRPSKSGSAAKKFTKTAEWILQKLNFLNVHSGKRNSTSNLESAVDDESDSEKAVDEDDDDDGGIDIQDTSLDGSMQSEELGEKSTKRPLKSNNNQRKTAKMKREEEEMKVLKTLAKSLEEDDKSGKTEVPKNQCSAFGEYVSQSLTLMDQRTRLIAMNGMQTAIFQAQMAQFQTCHTQVAGGQPIRPTAPTPPPAVPYPAQNSEFGYMHNVFTNLSQSYNE